MSITARSRPSEEEQSGNPAGRPKGARNRTTIAMQELLEGDTVAIRMCLERLVPVRKDRHVIFDLPKIERAADIPKATASLLEAVASGTICPACS